jgi:hypothetical protein
MPEQNLSVDIKIKADTSGAKEAEKAIDGVDKAVADLSKTEKEATNINGMYLDSLGRIHDASGKFVKVAAEDRAGLKERIKLQQQDTVTTTGAVQAKKELGKANSNAAMGFMALSNAVQDVQYGFGGIINNIPGVVSGMGLGMGVAGAAQIAGVAFSVLNKNVDIFGTEAAAAAKEATTTANEATALANSTQRAADAAADAAKKYAALNAALKKTEADYKAVSAASDEAIESAKRLQDIETKRGDLQSELAMAEIDAMAAGGQISKEDAAAKREGVRAQRAARAAALEEKAMEATVKAEEERAVAAEEAARAQRKILEERLKWGAESGLMVAGQRKAMEQALDAAEKEADAAKARAEDEKKTYDIYRGIIQASSRPTGGMGGQMLDDSEFGKLRRQRIDIEKANETEQRNRAQAIRQQLIEDAAARNRTGASSREEFQSRREGVLSKLGEYETAADRARRQASIMGGNLGLARETTAVRSRIASLTQSSAAAAAAQSGYGIGFTGPVPPQGFAADQKAADAAAKEAEKEAKELARQTVKMVRSLAAGLKFSKEEIAGLAALVDDLRTSK